MFDMRMNGGGAGGGSNTKPWGGSPLTPACKVAAESSLSAIEPSQLPPPPQQQSNRGPSRTGLDWSRGSSSSFNQHQSFSLMKNEPRADIVADEQHTPNQNYRTAFTASTSMAAVVCAACRDSKVKCELIDRPDLESCARCKMRSGTASFRVPMRLQGSRPHTKGCL